MPKPLTSATEELEQILSDIVCDSTIDEKTKVEQLILVIAKVKKIASDHKKAMLAIQDSIQQTVNDLKKEIKKTAQLTWGEHDYLSRADNYYLSNANYLPHIDGPSNKPSALQKAVEFGLEKCAAALLTAGANPWVNNGNYDSALNIAAKSGKSQFIPLFNQYKSGYAWEQLSFSNKDLKTLNWRAIHYAVFGGHHEFVKALCDAGADPTFTSANIPSPIKLAVNMQQEKCLKVLCNYNAAVNGIDGETQLPMLMLAVRDNKPQLVRQLCDAGADLNYTDINFGTALHLAAMLGNSTCMSVLLESTPKMLKVGTELGENQSPLDTALSALTNRIYIAENAEKNDLGVVYALLKAGANITDPKQLEKFLDKQKLHQTCEEMHFCREKLREVKMHGIYCNHFKSKKMEPIKVMIQTSSLKP